MCGAFALGGTGASSLFFQRAPGLTHESGELVAGFVSSSGNFPGLALFRGFFFRRLQRPVDRDFFCGREGLADHVLGKLAARDLLKGYDMDGYLGPA